MKHEVEIAVIAATEGMAVSDFKTLISSQEGSNLVEKACSYLSERRELHGLCPVKYQPGRNFSPCTLFGIALSSRRSARNISFLEVLLLDLLLSI